MPNLNPYTDHVAWWDEQLASGMSLDDLHAEWRKMNRFISMPDGTQFEVDRHNGEAINLVKAVCEEMGAAYVIAPFDWPKKGDNICIRTHAARFGCVTSCDTMGDLDDASSSARAALEHHRAGLFGSAPVPAQRRARP